MRDLDEWYSIVAVIDGCGGVAPPSETVVTAGRELGRSRIAERASSISKFQPRFLSAR